MGKFIKYVFITIGVLVLLVVGAAILVPVLFKDKIIEIAKKEANKTINAKLDFDNDISIGIFRTFPDLNLEVNNLRVINNAPFAGDTLADIGTLNATLDIMSVIRGEKIDVKSFELHKPKLQFKVLENGVANWDITFPDKDSLAQKGEDTSSNFRMGLKHYEINDGFIVYDDRQNHFFMKLDSLDHEGNGDFTEEVFDLVTETAIERLTVGYGGTSYLSNVKTNMKADFNMDMAKSVYTFKENELVLNELPLRFDGFIAMPGDDIDMDMTFKALKSDFKTFLSLIPAIYTKDFKNLKTSGSLALNGNVKGKYTDTEYPAFNVLLKIDNGMFQYPDLPYPVKNVFVDTKVTSPGGDLNNMVINVQRATFNMAGEQFDARLLVKQPMTDPDLDGALKGRVVLENMGKVIKLDAGTKLAGTIDADVKMKGKMSTLEKEDYQNFNASGFIGGQNIAYASKDLAQPVNVQTARLDFNPQTVKLSNFSMTSGPSDLKADGTFTNLLGYVFKNQLLKGTLNLNSTYFDINPWMAPDGAKPAPESEEKPMEAVDLPANIDFTLNTKMGRLIYDNMDLKNVSGAVVLRDKKLNINNLLADFLNGQIGISGTYDSKNINQPAADMKLNIKMVSIPELFRTFKTIQAYAPIAKYMSGNMSADVSLKTFLDKNMMPVLNSLSSIGRLNIPTGEVSNFLPLKEIASKLNLTRFDPLKVKDIRPSYFIENGRINLKEPIKFNIDKIWAKVTGSNGLDRTMDYKMELDIPAEDAKKYLKATITDLLKQKGITVPPGVDLPIGKSVKMDVFITGTFEKPIIKTSLKDFALNLAGTVKEQVKQEVEKKIEEVKTDVKEKVKAEADRIMKDAENRANQARTAANNLAEQTRKQGYDAAQRLENEATNPLAKVAAKKAADKMRQETDEKVNRIKNEGNKKADDIMKEARDRVSKL